MTRDRLKYAAYAHCGFLDGSHEHRAAQVALDAGFAKYEELKPIHSAYGAFWSEKDIKRQKKRDENELYCAMFNATRDEVTRNREAYGFVGFIGAVFLFFQIAAFVNDIVWPLVRFLISKRYGGKDNEVQQAIGAV